MSKKRTFVKLLSVAAVSLLLASCDDIVNYPSNKGDQIVSIDKTDDIYFNDLETIYDSIKNSNGIYARQLDNILYDIAKNDLSGDFAISDDFVKEQAYKTIFNAIKGGKYSTENIYNEYRYALSLTSSIYDIKLPDGGAISYSDAFKGVINPLDRITDGKINYTKAADKYLNFDYSDYITRKLTPSIYRQSLTGKFIYDTTYFSIGNTNARGVVVVKLNDVSDHAGSAVSFINKFYSDYLKNTSSNYSLYDLARMYKGVGLSDSEKKFIADNNLVTMQSKIDEDYKNVTDNKNDPNSKYASLESEFTNSYTYPLEHGKELKDSGLVINDLVTDGIYLKSTGLSDLPSDIKSRIFQTDIPSTLFPSDKQTNEYDNDYFAQVNGKWYLKSSKSESVNASGTIINYDSTSSTYYLVEITDFVTSSSIAKRDSDSAEEKTRKQKLALSVAYEMASSDTYVKDSIVYFLTHNNIVFSDPYFYSYIKETYPKVFETDN